MSFQKFREIISRNISNISKILQKLVTAKEYTFKVPDSAHKNCMLQK